MAEHGTQVQQGTARGAAEAADAEATPSGRRRTDPADSRRWRFASAEAAARHLGSSAG